MLFGDAGEYPAFDAEDRSRLVYLALKRSRVPVLAGVGSAMLDVWIGPAREAGPGTGCAAGVLLPPPFFFRYEPEDIREFYLQFARQLGPGTPIFLSHTPASGGIPFETVLDLRATGLFAGVEDGCGNLESALRSAGAADHGTFRVLSGNDANFTSARRAGSWGAISAAACAVPELIMALDRAIAAGRIEKIDRLDAALREFLAWSVRFPPPSAVTVATGLRGLKTGPFTAPLCPDKLKLLDEFRAWFKAWLPDAKRLSANG